MADFISDEQMATLENQGQAKPGFVSDEEMAKMAVPSGKPTSLGSKLLSGSLGFSQGATAGFGDEMAGLIGAIMDDKSRPFIERYREARDFARQLNQTQQKANPLSYGASELGGTLGLTAPLGPSVKVAGLLGGSYGLGGSQADLTQGKSGEAILDALKGAGTGVATAGTLNALSGVYAPSMKNFAARSALRASGARGAEMTPYELSPQGSDLLNKAKIALDQGVIGPVASKETMLARAQALKQLGGQKMGNILESPQVSGPQVNPLQLAQTSRSILTDFNPLAPSQAGKFRAVNKIAQDINAEGLVNKADLSVRDLQNLKGSFDEVARWNKLGQLPDSMVQAEKYRQASGLMRNTIDDVVSDKMGTQALKSLQQARDLHGAGAEFSELLNRSAGQENAGMAGIITKNPVEAIANIPIRKANQALAATSNTAANILNKAPQMLGPKYAPQIQQSLSKGGTAAAVTNNVLQQTDPEYRERLKSLMESNPLNP